ncbi:MAG: alpha-L-fucosidase [Clostridia bacterium]|nr:alpha-L-fucosidase [Clostridia bacterium]
MKYLPTEKQLKFMNWEMGAFFHFGIRTFNHGHRDWDGKDMSIDSFNPTNLDCEQWMRVIKKFGMKYAILTTKHHDGFANWPSKYTDYSVANTPWKDGKGDVVREFVDACRKYDIAVGLYYSPAQWGNAIAFKEGKEYDDYFINQISELLTNYGKIDYLWFDGCGSNGHKYDSKRIISVIRHLQPEITIFGMWDPDVEWVGNEDGYAPVPYILDRDVVVHDETVHKFMPLECDCRIRDSWFYDLNEYSLKTVDELIGMYEMSVGRGCNFLLNLGPDDNGLINQLDEKRLMELREEIDKRYGKPLEFESIKEVDESTYSIEYSCETLKKIADTVNIPLVKSVIIEEDISSGQAVLDFRLYAHIPTRNPISDNKYCVFRGETIGRKMICRFPAVRSPKFTLEILRSNEKPIIKSIKAFG